ncbi:hypothetical protein [Bifidobacterium sp. SO1]|uniref:hypothetical protein n=1 Tax=Bifidobacterium sp. SO1 TaxID=2809029 RepID=UPI001BDD7AE0|nr:hypothetical protein [Bifidobacterium sp. SO1]MBT1161216.1 hypothetical protein [Bifidobacterium sp. SO1]
MGDEIKNQTVTDDSQDTTGQTATAPETQSTAPTVEPSAPETKPEQPAQRPALKDQPVEEQLSFWQQASRKHEKQAKDNYDKLQKTEASYAQTQNELHDARMENAFLKAQKAHPNLTDAMIALCDKTTPDEVAAWADKIAETFHLDEPVKTAPSATPVRDLADRIARTRGEGIPAISSGSMNDGYKKAMAMQEQRRQARSGK